jgi:hypothetical protein
MTGEISEKSEKVIQKLSWFSSCRLDSRKKKIEK